VALVAQALIDSALARSTKNTARMANQPVELLGVVRRALQGLFAVGARVNPEFYSLEQDVAFAAGGWARPENAESVWRIEQPDDTEVVVVPRFDRQADVARPAVYRMGQVYKPAGHDLDPVGGPLTFLFAKTPDAIAGLGASIDAMFPDHFESLLVDEIAIYLAMKDDRREEVGSLIISRDAWLRLYVAFLEHETVGEVRRMGLRRTFTLPELTPLLAGAAA
jgi:hypothetical protein